MELKSFIRETIENIVEGVVAAQKVIAGKGATINPERVTFREAGQWNNHNSGMPRFVEFDVGLTSVNKSGTTEGIGVFLGGVSLGKKNEEGADHTAVTRIKFSVPLVLPSGGGGKEE